MAAAIIEAIGAIGTIADTASSVLSFGQQLMPSQQTQGTTVRIAVGLNGVQGLDDADGEMPYVVAYNENYAKIDDNNGQENSHKGISSGSFLDTFVPGGQQATYLRVQAFNDAVCVSYVTTTWADGSQYGFALGDVAAGCPGDHAWYYSNIYVGTDLVDCGWVDADNSNGASPAAIDFHVPSFSAPTGSALPNSSVETDFACNAPQIWFLGGTDTNVGQGDMKKKRDSTTPTSEALGESIINLVSQPSNSSTIAQKTKIAADKLVIGSHEHHKASRLCEDKNSYGPSFASKHEGLFCDMTAKQTHPICQNYNLTENCFDLDTKALLGAKAPVTLGSRAVASRDTAATKKAYNHILSW